MPAEEFLAWSHFALFCLNKGIKFAACIFRLKQLKLNFACGGNITLRLYDPKLYWLYFNSSIIIYGISKIQIPHNQVCYCAYLLNTQWLIVVLSYTFMSTLFYTVYALPNSISWLHFLKQYFDRNTFPPPSLPASSHPLSGTSSGFSPVFSAPPVKDIPLECGCLWFQCQTPGSRSLQELAEPTELCSSMAETTGAQRWMWSHCCTAIHQSELSRGINAGPNNRRERATHTAAADNDTLCT